MVDVLTSGLLCVGMVGLFIGFVEDDFKLKLSSSAWTGAGVLLEVLV